MAFTGYARTAGGAEDDASFFGASVDVDGAVGAALRALDDGPSLGAAAGDGAGVAGAGGAAARWGRAPPSRPPPRRPQGPTAVVSPPPSLPDSVFLLPGPSERRRQAQAEAAAAAAEAAAAAAAAPQRGGRLALLSEDAAAEDAAALDDAASASDHDDSALNWDASADAPSQREATLEEARRAAAAAEFARRTTYGAASEVSEDMGWQPLASSLRQSSRPPSASAAVPTRSRPASAASSDASADEAFARGYRAAMAAAVEQAAAVQPSPPPPQQQPDVPIPLPRRSPVPPSAASTPRVAQRGEEGYAETVVSGDEGGDDPSDDPFEERMRASMAPPIGLLGRMRAPGSTAGTTAGGSDDLSEDSWMRPAKIDEIITARREHDRWGAPQPLPRNVAAQQAASAAPSESEWGGDVFRAVEARNGYGSAEVPPPPPPVYLVEDARDKFAAVAASVARAQAEAATRKPAAPFPEAAAARERRPERGAPAPPPSAAANAPPRRAARPGGAQADPGPPQKPPHRDAYRATDEDHVVPVPDLVGDFTIVPGALLEAGTRIVSAVRAEIDKDVAAKRQKAAQTLENLILALSPGRGLDGEGGPPLLGWQRALLEAGASVEQELARRQARASAAFRAVEQEQLRISLLMQNTAGAAASGGKTVLQRWLEGAFGSKAEYDAYIAGIAATMCMAPGAKASFVNVLRSLEPMRREAVAKRQARLASAHHATRAAVGAGPDAALAVVGLPADAPPLLSLAPGTPSPLALSPAPSEVAPLRGAAPQYAQHARYGAAARPASPPASTPEPGPWEPPILDVRRPGSPQESVVLERLPGMTDEDLERLADFMGSDAGSIWGDGADPDSLTEAEAAERVARMVAEARAAAAMRAAVKQSGSPHRDDFNDFAMEDAEVAAVPQSTARPGSAGAYSALAASTPDGASRARAQQQQQQSARASPAAAGGAASPAPSLGQRLPQREPSPLPPSADYGYNAFSYDAPSENTRAAWEAQLLRAASERAPAAPPSAAGDSSVQRYAGARRPPQPSASSVASGMPGQTFFRGGIEGDEAADEEDFSYQAPPGRSVHGSFAGSAPPSVAASMPMFRDATRQPSTGPSSTATSVAAPEDFGRVPPAPSLWQRATAPAQQPAPPPRRGVQPLPPASGGGPSAGDVDAGRAAAVASLAPKHKPPPSESDWGFDRNAVLERKRHAAEAAAAAAAAADRSLAASMAAAGIGGGGPDGASPTGWVRDRGTGAWSPAQSRPASRADVDAAPQRSVAPASSAAQRRPAKATTAPPPSKQRTQQPPAAVAVVDERWRRVIGDVLRIAVLLVLGAVLAFVMVLTFF